MSLISKKNNIASSISIISSLSGVLNANTIDTNSNIFNNKSKDSIGFMLNLLTIIIGSVALKRLLTDILNKSVPNIEPIIKSEFKKLVLPVNSDRLVSEDVFINGVNLPLSEIDYGRKFKVNESDANLVMDTSNNSLDYKIYRSILTKQTQETNDVFIKYNQTDETINIRPKRRDKIGKILSDVIDNTVFVNKNVIISLVIDFIFGSLISILKKTNKQLTDDENFNRMINKLVDNPDDGDFFILNPEDIEIINNKVFSKLNGNLPLDYDCGIVESDIDVETIRDIISNDDIVSGLDNAFDNLTPQNPQPQKIDSISNEKVDTLNNIIKNNNRFQNKSSLKDGLYKGFISAIINILIKETFLSPKSLLIIGFSKKMINPSAVLGKNVDLITNQKNILKCLSKTIVDEINSFIFGFLKREILRVTKPYAVAILNEKLKNYTGILSSLSGFRN